MGVAGGPAQMPFAGWGDPSQRAGLPDHARSWLRRTLGVLPADSRPQPPAAEAVNVPDSRLSQPMLADLGQAVGPEHVLTGAVDRALHAGGKSYLDLLRRRAGDAAHAPDAIVLPGTAEEVAALLHAAVSHGIAVVPFGGGTSVVGGVEPTAGRFAAVISMDLRRMDRLLALDPISRTATFQPGLRGPAAERLLADRGFTLGHLPQSFEYATVGGFVATRSAGQASTGYGRIDELVVALTAVTPAGTWRLGRGAASAAGPDLRALLVGSEGTLGVITEVTVRVRPLPAVRRYEGFLVSSFQAGQDLLRALAQDDIAPDVARLSDSDETAVTLLLSGSGAKGSLTRGYVRARAGAHACLLILGWEGAPQRVLGRRRAAAPSLRAARAVQLGRGAGQRWLHGRYHGPYLRDDLMDAGVLVETLETSATWTDLPAVRNAVRAAVHGALGTPPSVVMCHISHLYPHGASLYFTVLARADRDDPVAQWQRAKDAATDAIVTSGGTVTHHHAVGADHRRWLAAEIGELGVAVLRAAKQVLDPGGILNPDTLLPAGGE